MIKRYMELLKLLTLLAFKMTHIYNARLCVLHPSYLSGQHSRCRRVASTRVAFVVAGHCQPILVGRPLLFHCVRFVAAPSSARQHVRGLRHFVFE